MAVKRIPVPVLLRQIDKDEPGPDIDTVRNESLRTTIVKIQPADHSVSAKMSNKCTLAFLQDELLRLRSSAMVVASGFRWRRSRWGRNCPVALKEGWMVPGQPEFSVRSVFIDVEKHFQMLDQIKGLSALLVSTTVQLSG